MVLFTFFFTNISSYLQVSIDAEIFNYSMKYEGKNFF